MKNILISLAFVVCLVVGTALLFLPMYGMFYLAEVYDFHVSTQMEGIALLFGVVLVVLFAGVISDKLDPL